MCILQIAFNITALIVLNIKPGPVSEELQRDYYPLIEGMFSLPINLPWTIYGKAFRVSTLRWHRSSDIDIEYKLHQN